MSAEGEIGNEERRKLLELLNRERQTILYPGVTRFVKGGVIRDVSADGKSCEVVYASCSEGEVDQVIAHQIRVAQESRYDLEWKLYGHDRPECLSERLVAAGFEAGDREAFMVFRADRQSLDRFGIGDADVQRITDRAGLADYQRITEEIYGKDRASRIEQFALLLENHPDSMSVYVAYVDGEPAACGRVYFHERSLFAGLYGGSTREHFRKRGLFTGLVGVRIREAVSRGGVNICVDALPTSEPILKKIGFEEVTYTQPFCLDPT